MTSNNVMMENPSNSLQTAYRLITSSLLIAVLISCDKDNDSVGVIEEESPAQQLTIFFTNDMHGRLDNFAKIKHIVDAERAENNVLLVCGGDIFSGSPIVDQYSEKGYPIIDIMNQTGYDVSVLGNHEFDYGLSVLNDRIEQADFDFVCANVDASSSILSQPKAFTTLSVGDLKVSFLGLVETQGQYNNTIIPLTHPWRITDLTFQVYSDVVSQYEDLKAQEDADLLVALTHLGSNADFSLANAFPFFDLVIGGHSNDLNQSSINDTPVLMAGANLSHLGKIELTIKDKEVINSVVTLIPLSSYDEVDETLALAIADYNDAPEFSEVVGFANSHHSTTELACFYTTALKDYMAVDVSFQNNGGIRSSIDQGDITKFEIFSMDPFNNGSVVFTMTAAKLKDFFQQANQGFHVSGITLERNGNELTIFDENGNEMDNDRVVTIGINDYIPALYEDYFSLDEAIVKELTTAESVIQYLKTINSTVDYEGCNSYFKY